MQVQVAIVDTSFNGRYSSPKRNRNQPMAGTLQNCRAGAKNWERRSNGGY